MTPTIDGRLLRRRFPRRRRIALPFRLSDHQLQAGPYRVDRADLNVHKAKRESLSADHILRDIGSHLRCLLRPTDPNNSARHDQVSQRSQQLPNSRRSVTKTCVISSSGCGASTILGFAPPFRISASTLFGIFECHVRCPSLTPSFPASGVPEYPAAMIAFSNAAPRSVLRFGASFSVESPSSSQICWERDFVWSLECRSPVSPQRMSS
jgi:hypothetical protein